MRFNKYFFCYCCLVIFLSVSCISKNKQSAATNKYIYSHTAGTILSGTPVRIWLEGTAKSEFQSGEVLPASVLQFSPAVKGQLTLSDASMLEFIPDQPFKNGQAYQVKFHLGVIMDVPQEYQYFEFPLQITELQASFTPGFLISENNDTLSYEADRKSVV